MIAPKQFREEISPYFNANPKKYISALVSEDCWQATPGKVVDLVRNLGIAAGGTVMEDCRVLEACREGNIPVFWYRPTIKNMWSIVPNIL